eukprot:CAMPEP_0169076250 /NCGR_PEP_ID=MMETSP1015-20121227/8247_1 /TAXON_ID=342587 /ORGANISM="Karlodinium micrum, Strain CCMP2283" /LENGTH=32 /DNA_ID= /DNA_START= /DNA_END= /DNA_ORIENTATION=
MAKVLYTRLDAGVCLRRKPEENYPNSMCRCIS